jgi:hypothetical protein
MSAQNKSHKNRRRKLEKYSVTKTLDDTQKRELGKSGKILTLDYVGMPCYGKIVKLEGFHPQTPTIYTIVPIYQECKSCESYLGHLENINSDELDNLCIDCFKIQIDEEPDFSMAGELHYPCTSCGLYLEKGVDLFSKLDGICNHCYLRKSNLNKDHSCISCDPSFPIPQDNLHEKIQVIASLENPKIFSKTNKPKTKGNLLEQLR